MGRPAAGDLRGLRLAFGVLQGPGPLLSLCFRLCRLLVFPPKGLLHTAGCSSPEADSLHTFLGTKVTCLWSRHKGQPLQAAALLCDLLLNRLTAPGAQNKRIFSSIPSPLPLSSKCQPQARAEGVARKRPMQASPQGAPGGARGRSPPEQDPQCAMTTRSTLWGLLQGPQALPLIQQVFCANNWK